MPKTKERAQLNDGVLAVYALKNSVIGGGKPVSQLVVKQPLLRYEERTVGMNRYWSGLQNKVRVDWMVRVQRIKSISTQDIAIRHDGEQYKIVQIQYPHDVEPACMDLSLERVTERYAVN